MWKHAMEIEFLTTQKFLPFTFITMKTTYTDKSWIKHELANIDVQIEYDDNYYEDEFFHSDAVKIDVMPHRRYRFLQELDLKREYLTTTYEKDDYYYEEWKEEQRKFKKICKENRVFWLDFYEHSAIAFSLVEKRQNIGYYEFDRTRNIWYIAIERRRGLTYAKAMKIAEETIEEYNNYCNWRIYEYRIADAEDNALDCCTGFYKEEHAEEEAIAYMKWYLKEKWIEFTKVELN